MNLNVINNFKAFYYNTLVNFYLYFNTVVPCYDDVILSLSITSFKNIINNHSISLKSIKENRLMKLIYSLNDKDKIVLDDDGFVFVDFHPDNTTMLGFDDDDDEEGNPVDTEATPEGTEATTEGTEETTEGTEETPEATETTEVTETTEGTEATTEGTEVTTEGTEATEVTEETPEGTEATTEGTEATPEGTEATTEEEPHIYDSLEKKNN